MKNKMIQISAIICSDNILKYEKSLLTKDNDTDPNLVSASVTGLCSSQLLRSLLGRG